MKGSHPVGGVGKMDVHMSHVNPILLIDDGSAPIIRAAAGSMIEFFHNGHQLGNHRFQITLGPFFQCLCQDGVVGIGTDIRHNLYCFLKRNALLAQKSDQFRDHHAGMGVIDLNGSIISQVMKVGAPLHAFLYDQLGTCADHEILLIDAKHPACFIGIIRIQKQGQIFLYLILIKLNALSHQIFINGIQIKKIQLIGSSMVTGYSQLVEPCLICLSGQHHRKHLLCGFCPAVCMKPVVRRLILQFLLKTLAEQAAVIPKPNAVPRQI